MRFAWFSSKLKFHPEEANLLAYRDGELPPRQLSRVGNHLKRCASCQSTLASFEMDIRAFEEMTTGLDAGGSRVEIGMFQLQDAIHNRLAGGNNSQSRDYWFELPDDLLGDVHAELKIYLGSQAAKKFLGRVKTESHTPLELVGVIEPLMMGLLGTDGGSAVAKRVAFLCGSSGVSSRPYLNQ